MSEIYLLYCIPNDKCYVGKTVQGINERWKGHLSEARNKPKNESGYLNNAIRKYGEKKFRIYTISSAVDEIQLNKLEEFYISYFNTLSPNGMNLTKGGEGCKASDETKKKMSSWQKGKPKSEKHKKSMSEYAKNRPKEHAEKIRQFHIGRKASEETKKKMSKVRRKLSDEDIDKILKLLKTETQVSIAKKFQVSEKHISRIKNGWRPLK